MGKSVSSSFDSRGGIEMDYPEIAEVFNDAFREDPYGTAIAIIREAMSAAADNHGAMNEDEARILNRACQLLMTDDPALVTVLPSPAEFGLEVDDSGE